MYLAFQQKHFTLIYRLLIHPRECLHLLFLNTITLYLGGWGVVMLVHTNCTYLGLSTFKITVNLHTAHTNTAEEFSDGNPQFPALVSL